MNNFKLGHRSIIRIPMKNNPQQSAKKLSFLPLLHLKNSLSDVTAIIAHILVMVTVFSCGREKKASSLPNVYYSHEGGIQTGGVKVVSVKTSKGEFKIWTKSIGNNPKIKVLLLSGGPGASHEYLECFESFFPRESIEFIYYDQLGTGNSEVPKDASVYELDRSVEEVEQVRKALGLNNTNFYLFGHSWGGIVAMEYALKYQENLKALVVSDMVSSARDYNNYAANVLAKDIEPKALGEIRGIESRKYFGNPRYMELLMQHFYSKHICRLPQWPEPLVRSFGKLNQEFYTRMQGPSEFGLSGKLISWDRKKDLAKLVVPTLTIGAKYDTMDPGHMKWMAAQVKNGSFLYCSRGSHMCFYDDQETYFHGLVKFIKGVDAGQKIIRL
jgi:proline iminopeptidase